jgi:RNA polymerase sigma-70 factor (ECF subfamily)
MSGHARCFNHKSLARPAVKSRQRRPDVEERQVIECFLTTRTEEAFCALFEAICARVRRYFLLRGLDKMTAEDLAQNVFVKVYRQVGELREAEHFYGWLFAIVRHEMISYWRRERSRPAQVELDLLNDWQRDYLMMEPEVISAMRLMDLLSPLDPADRDLILLRFVEGLSYEELATALNLPLGTVKWRIFKARKKLAWSMSASTECRARQRIN